ncbi:MAG: iron complex outermembrane receptor protein [Myxococcota bacterium]
MVVNFSYIFGHSFRLEIMRVVGTIAALFFGIWSPLAIAGDDDIEDWDLEGLLEVVVTESDHARTTANAPASVTVLSREDIALSGVVTIPDMLRRVPGLQVVEVSPGNFVVAARGFGGLQDNNVLVLVDGVALNTLADGAVRWSGLPVGLPQVDRIEVIRGPVSTLYGANASSAVVNIITNPADPRPMAGLTLGGRTRGQVERHFWASGGGGRDELSWRVHVRGSDVRTRSEALDLRHRGGLGTDLSVQFNPKGRWSGATRLAWTVDMRGGENAVVADRVEYMEPATMLTAGATYTLGQMLDSVSVEGSFASRQTSQLGQSLGPTQDATQENGGFVTSTVRVNLPGGGTVIAASGVGADRVTAPYLPTGGDFYAHGHVRGTWAQPLGNKWRLNADYRVDKHVLTRTQGSWRASAQFRTSEETFFRVSAGSAFRRPSWIESASRFRDPIDDVILLEGEADLEPQRNTNIEAAMVFVSTDGLAFRPTVFVGSFDSLISQDSNPFVFKSFDTVESERWLDTVGLEVEASWERDTTFVPRIAFTAMHIGEPVDTTQTVGVPEQNSRFTASASVRGELGRVRYGMSADWMSARSFDTAVGLPIQQIATDIPAMARIGGEVHYAPGRDGVLSLGALVETNTPSTSQSPLPGAVSLGTRAMMTVMVRE